MSMNGFQKNIFSSEDLDKIKTKRKKTSVLQEEATHLFGRDNVDVEDDVVGVSCED